MESDFRSMRSEELVPEVTQMGANNSTDWFPSHRSRGSTAAALSHTLIQLQHFSLIFVCWTLSRPMMSFTSTVYRPFLDKPVAKSWACGANTLET